MDQQVRHRAQLCGRRPDVLSPRDGGGTPSVAVYLRVQRVLRRRARGSEGEARGRDGSDGVRVVAASVCVK